MKAEIRKVTLSVNGREVTAETEVRTLLSDFLRHDLGFTGTHVGCEHGVCGACTVLVDGAPVRSCLLLAVQAEGSVVETVEGLAPDGQLSAMQQAMRDEHGLQCGFCTPGILMSMLAAERAGVSCDEACGDVLGGHVCRCTGYQQIRAAVRRRWAAGLAEGDSGQSATEVPA